MTEAMRLFAERGFRGTTVGDIEEAAGLAPRAGGLYKHFRSKEEVLEAGIERQVSGIDLIEPALATLPLGDPRAELMLIGRWTLDELGSEMPLMKVVQKDGDRFPELVAKVRDRIIARGHRQGVAVVGGCSATCSTSVRSPRWPPSRSGRWSATGSRRRCSARGR